MKKIFYLLILLVSFSFSISASVMKEDVSKTKQEQALKILSELPDSTFVKYYPPNLLEDFTYKKMAKEGWTTREIFAITDNYVSKNKKEVRAAAGYGLYKKQWRPYWYGLVPNDTIVRRVDEVVPFELQQKVNQAFAEDADEYLPREFYTIDRRMSGQRDKGRWRHNAILPASGRIHWVQTHPTDKDKLMLIPDGDGIWRTDNGGKNWIPVTDRIPNRFHRSQARGYAIPTDPDDWNHFFAFMNNTTLVYETFDGGETWAEVPGAKQASSTGLKRGYAFRDAQGTLKIIGVVRNTYTGHNGQLFISSNKGVSWDRIDIPTEMQDVSANGTRSVWLQEFAFDPEDRDLIYITTSGGILRSTNGLRKVNGKFELERMSFKVYNQAGTQVLHEGNAFPIPADGPTMLEIDPRNPNKMWAAMGVKNTTPHHSALFYSEDKGKTWVTLNNTYARIGSGQVFGNEAPAGWLGGFGVNFMEPNFVYGCSMSSAKSSNGGKTFNEFQWGIVMKGPHPDGKLYNVSSARHNADNHVIVSTPSGRLFRGSDAGILMIDKDINNREWTNISGDMGQNLFYAARLNEFGDMTIIGNTQDVDNQTYRYGRWGTWRGYEGSTVGINPLSNETYFSGGGGGTLEGTSWGDSWKAAFSKSDPILSNWYLWRGDRMIGAGATQSDIGIVRDIGRSVQPLFSNASNKAMQNRDFCTARDLSIGSSLFVLRTDGNIVRFDNGAESYIDISRPGAPGYSGSAIAVNPENINEIYVADTQNGILKTTNGGTSWTSISKGINGIPAGVAFNKLYFHEGSGDLYAVSNSSGIFFLENGSTNWRLWMKGYNPAAFDGAEINYATQEMMIYDYGRGIWIADLENPSDRFFKNGFKLKETSNANGVRTFGMESSWDIPLYYKYKWTVNGVERTESPYKFLTANDVKAGDKVQLTLTLREAPDVITQSEVFIVSGAINNERPEYKAGNSLRSLSGRMDLGHVDAFDEDFTVALWVKPRSITQAAIIGNRKLDSRDQQGWLLHITNGILRFTYAPLSNFYQPSYEQTVQYENSVSSSANAIAADEWSHVVVTVERTGNIRLYVNGVLKGSQVRRLQDVGLNSIQPLSLMADGYEYNPLDGNVDELKIWRKALTEEEIRETMFAQIKQGDADLIYYNDFNAETTGEQRDNIMDRKIEVRTRAVASYPEMSMAVNATYSAYETVSATAKNIQDKGENILTIQSNKSKDIPMAISRFDNVYHSSKIRGMSEEHFEFAPNVYKIDHFAAIVSSDSLYLTIPMSNATEFAGEDIYIGNPDADKADWREYKERVHVENGKVVLKLRSSEVDGKLIAFVKVKPAIQLKSTEATDEGEFYVYDDKGTVSYPLEANLVKGMPQPTAPYSLVSSDANITASKLIFANNKGTANFTINPAMLTEFNSESAVTISGEDNRMIPYRFTVRNKVAPTSKGTALSFNGGGANVGSAGDYAALNNSNTITMMGWIKIDDNDFFTTGSVRPLIFFRGGGYTTGIHFQNGEMRSHWNEESWSWSLASGLKLTSADRGKWVHIAMVTTPNSISYFLNGKKFTSSRTINRTHIVSELMLGKNQSGDTWFKGAIDQVALWSRSLSDAEVMKYMYDRVLLNDPGLVAYLNMDMTDENGTLVDLKTNGTVAINGSATAGQRASFPFEIKSQSEHSGTAISSTTDALAVKMPTGIKGKYYISNFQGLPYNYAVAGLVPLYNGSFVVNYNSPQNFTSGREIEVTYRSSQIKAGQTLNLAVRPLGSEAKFTKSANVKATVDGEITISLDATTLNDAFEGVWYTTAASLPVLSMEVEGMGTDNKVVLKKGSVGIPVTFTNTSDKPAGDIDLIVDNEFVKFENSTINLANTNSVTDLLLIQRDKIDQFGFTTVKVSFVGANTSAKTINVGLEAEVELQLKNGDTANKITATGLTQALEVEAKVVRGVVLDPIQLKVETDLSNAVSIGTDYLTVTGGKKELSNFQHTRDESQLSQSDTELGWNSTLNPYLSSFLMSKQENIERMNLSSYVYRFDQDNKNFIPYDIRFIDSDLNLRPMEPIFVQVNSEDAILSFKTQGRNTNYNRKNTNNLVLSEEDEVILELWHKDIMYDRVVVRITGYGDELFVFDHDAPKMNSIDSRNPILYVLGMDGTRYSVKSYKQEARDIPVGFKTSLEGDYTFKVVKKFRDSSWGIILTDGLNEYPITSEGDIHTFNVANNYGTDDSRFVLKMNMPTGIEDMNINNPSIWAKDNICHVDNLTYDSKVEIFNSNGQRVVSEKVYQTEWHTVLQKGVYIVRVTNDENRVFSGKIIMN